MKNFDKARPKELAAALKARYPVFAENMVIEIQGALFRVRSFGKTRAIIETLHGAEIRRGHLTADAHQLVARAAAGKGEPWSVKWRRWLGKVAVVALTLAVPAEAACPPGHGPFGRSATTPDGSHLVCAVDVTPGKYELFSVAAGSSPAAPVRLSPAVPADRDDLFDVIAFAIAPDSTRVAFACDKTKWTAYDLYTVSVSGGAATRVNKPLQSEHDVDDFLWASDRVVWRQGRNTSGWWMLYSATATGGDWRRISQEIPISGRVERGFTLLDGNRIRYSADVAGNGQSSWYVVGAAGGRILREIFADGFESGSRGAWS